MKKTTKLIALLALLLSLSLSLISCSLDTVWEKMPWNKEDTQEIEGLWKDADYTEDANFGEGAKTITLEVKAEDKTVKFTIHTDKATVGEALLDHKLIDGENGEYGLYVKEVNGITADYDIDQSYWAFYIDGEYAMTGVDSTEIREDVTYQLVYTK